LRNTEHEGWYIAAADATLKRSRRTRMPSCSSLRDTRTRYSAWKCKGQSMDWLLNGLNRNPVQYARKLFNKLMLLSASWLAADDVIQNTALSLANDVSSDVMVSLP